MRLEKTAQLAKQMNFDYFTTTLTISPLKKSVKLNEIGYELGNTYGVEYLLSDFNHANGYTVPELNLLYEKTMNISTRR